MPVLAFLIVYIFYDGTFKRSEYLDNILEKLYNMLRKLYQSSTQWNNLE